MRITLLWFITFALVLPGKGTGALGIDETLPHRILEILPQNIVIISRGAEDGLALNEHVKILSTDGFIARGLVIKSNKNAAFVRLYRVVRPYLVSKDVIYALTSLRLKQIPPKYLPVLRHDYADKLSDEFIPDFRAISDKRYANQLFEEIPSSQFKNIKEMQRRTDDKKLRTQNLSELEEKIRPYRKLYEAFWQ